ncbi:MAG: sulfatase [Candidatus Hydrogenedentes bacterium]|nr:sulfatase [Candidatus Hydrogenedentota bacterium]
MACKPLPRFFANAVRLLAFIFAAQCLVSFLVRAETLAAPADVLRLTETRLHERKGESRDPFVVPLKSLSAGVKGDKLDLAAVASILERKPDSVHIAANPSFDFIRADVDFDAAAYNAFDVTMRIDSGTYCRLNWVTDREPALQRNPWIPMPLFSDGEVHTYRFTLDQYHTPSWAGRVKRIAFCPSLDPATAEIYELKLLYIPPEAPDRVTIAAQTHEALAGTQAPWTFTVPPAAVFDVHTGMLHDVKSKRAPGEARFTVTLDSPEKSGIPLLDRIMKPAEEEAHRTWLPFQVDLSAYAGQEIALRLNVDYPMSPEGAYAFWGNPMVFSRPDKSEAVPVVLIVCDTLRADHLSCYGYPRETTPHLDAFANEAVLFENALCQETWTLPSHATLFTGLYPKHHGMTASANLSESTVTLAEALRGAGYLCAGFTGFSFWLYPWRGFAQGFDLYNTPDWRFRSIADTGSRVNQWLDAHSQENVFLFFHNFDAHSKPALQFDGLPYGPEDSAFLHFAKEFASPPSFTRDDREKTDAEAFLLAANRNELTVTQEELEYCIALYDDSIRMVDHYLHQTFEKLKALGLYDRAVIVVTSDHGEEFGEHGVFGHANVYETSAHVPLLVRFPGGKRGGTRCPHVIQLTDVFPTILAAAGVPLPNAVDGLDLAQLLDGAAPPRDRAYVQRLQWKAVRTSEWKLLRDDARKAYELYDVVNDRHEKKNVLAPTAKPVAVLQPDLDAFFAIDATGWHFAYASDDPAWKGKLDIVSNAPLDTATLLKGLDRQNLVMRGPSVDLNMGHDGANELLLRSADSSAKLMITATAELPVTLAVGNQPPRSGTKIQLVLDPAADDFPEPPAEGLNKPYVRIWNVPAPAGRSAAKPLSEEAREELRALGYTGE